MSWFHSIRLLACLIAILLAIPLAVARTLDPSPQGLGTHQQLGLPPCSMRVLFGMRCPACGMTTSWSHLTRGHLVASARANSGGAVLGILVSVVIVVAIRTAWTNRMPMPGRMRSLGIGVVIAGAVTVVDWVLRLIG